MADYKMQINYRRLAPRCWRAIDRVVAHVAMALNSIAKATRDDLTLPDAWYHVKPAPDDLADLAQVKDRFRRWVLGCGLRDCAEAIKPVLIEARSHCSVLKLFKSGEVDGEQFTAWNERDLAEGAKFEKRGLPEMILHLRKQYDAELLPESTDGILSINKARNCLVHREGVVDSKEDCSSDGSLTVMWRRIELYVNGQEGERIITPGTDSDLLVEGEALKMRTTDGRRAFSPGDIIVFTPQDFSEMCKTLGEFAEGLANNINDYAMSMGIEIKGDASPDAPLWVMRSTK